MKQPNSDESYSEAETVRRRDATIRNMIATPPQKHEPLKAAKRAKRKSKPSAKSRRIIG